MRLSIIFIFITLSLVLICSDDDVDVKKRLFSDSKSSGAARTRAVLKSLGSRVKSATVRVVDFLKKVFEKMKKLFAKIKAKISKAVTRAKDVFRKVKNSKYLLFLNSTLRTVWTNMPESIKSKALDGAVNLYLDSDDSEVEFDANDDSLFEDDELAEFNEEGDDWDNERFESDIGQFRKGDARMISNNHGFGKSSRRKKRLSSVDEDDEEYEEVEYEYVEEDDDGDSEAEDEDLEFNLDDGDDIDFDDGGDEEGDDDEGEEVEYEYEYEDEEEEDDSSDKKGLNRYHDKSNKHPCCCFKAGGTIKSIGEIDRDGDEDVDIIVSDDQESVEMQMFPIELDDFEAESLEDDEVNFDGIAIEGDTDINLDQEEYLDEIESVQKRGVKKRSCPCTHRAVYKREMIRARTLIPSMMPTLSQSINAAAAKEIFTLAKIDNADQLCGGEGYDVDNCIPIPNLKMGAIAGIISVKLLCPLCDIKIKDAGTNVKSKHLQGWVFEIFSSKTLDVFIYETFNRFPGEPELFDGNKNAWKIIKDSEEEFYWHVKTHL